MTLSASNTNTSAANTAAVITYTAGIGVDVGRSHVLRGGILFGYSATPTATGSLKIEMDGTTVFGPVPVTAGGAGFLPFKELAANPGTSLVITLAAGGVGITGNITVTDYERR